MSYCTHCGAYIPMDGKHCPACGKAAFSGGTQKKEAPKAESVQQSWEPWKEEPAKAADNRRISVLSYVGPLFLLPLWLHKSDPFVRFHANQGCVLFILECLIGILLGDGLLAVAGTLFCLWCLVLGAKNVAAGRMAPLPFIGKFQGLK